jgi:hypothetical protein
MRKFVLLLILALAFSVMVPAAFAQDAAETFCGDLSAEDCAVLEQSATAMEGVSSSTANFNLQIDVENIPDVPALSIVLTGDAAYTLDAAALEALEVEEGTELTVEQSLAAFTTALSAFDGELNLTLTLPEELVAQAGIPASTIPLELALVDGIGYINFDTIDPLTGGMLAQQGLEGWGGINFIDLVTQLVAENPEMLDQLDMASAGTEMTDMSQFEAFEQYITVSRGADVDGQAVFTTDIDFGGFVSDPAFQDLIAESMETSGQTLDEAELQQALGAIQLLGQQTTLNFSQSIDTATGFVTGGEFNLNIDLTSVLQASGETVNGEAFVSIVGTIDYSGINDTTVSAPENANIAPTEMLLGTLSGSF